MTLKLGRATFLSRKGYNSEISVSHRVNMWTVFSEIALDNLN